MKSKSCPWIKLKEYRKDLLLEFLDELISANQRISLNEIYKLVYDKFGEEVCEPQKLCPYDKKSSPEYKHTIRLTLWDGKTKRGFYSDSSGNWSKKDLLINKTPDLQIDYTKEFTGEIIYGNKNHIKANFLHGVIVDKLKEELEKKELLVGNDKQRDLYVLDNNGKIKYLFEIKTDMNTDSIYKGVGQLLMYSLFLSSKPKLILVLPNTLKNKKIEEKMKIKLGIQIISYELDKQKKVRFKNLATLFNF